MIYATARFCDLSKKPCDVKEKMDPVNTGPHRRGVRKTGGRTKGGNDIAEGGKEERRIGREPGQINAA